MIGWSEGPKDSLAPPYWLTLLFPMLLKSIPPRCPIEERSETVPPPPAARIFPKSRIDHLPALPSAVRSNRKDHGLYLATKFPLCRRRISFFPETQRTLPQKAHLFSPSPLSHTTSSRSTQEHIRNFGENFIAQTAAKPRPFIFHPPQDDNFPSSAVRVCLRRSQSHSQTLSPSSSRFLTLVTSFLAPPFFSVTPGRLLRTFGSPSIKQDQPIKQRFPIHPRFKFHARPRHHGPSKCALSFLLSPFPPPKTTPTPPNPLRMRGAHWVQCHNSQPACADLT